MANAATTTVCMIACSWFLGAPRGARSPSISYRLSWSSNDLSLQSCCRSSRGSRQQDLADRAIQIAGSWSRALPPDVLPAAERTPRMAACVRLRGAMHCGGRDDSPTLLVRGHIGSPAFKILVLLSSSNLVEFLLSNLSVSQLSDALAAQPFVDDPSVLPDSCSRYGYPRKLPAPARGARSSGGNRAPRNDRRRRT